MSKFFADNVIFDEKLINRKIMPIFATDNSLQV